MQISFILAQLFTKTENTKRPITFNCVKIQVAMENKSQDEHYDNYTFVIVRFHFTLNMIFKKYMNYNQKGVNHIKQYLID